LKGGGRECKGKDYATKGDLGRFFHISRKGKRRGNRGDKREERGEKKSFL